MRPMTPPRLEWLLPEPVPEPPTFAGFGAPVATMLSRRGFADDVQLRRFLDAGAGALHDVSRMADAEVALERIGRAVDTGQRIAIWGDYDADGMTAVVVWVMALRRLGIEAVRYIPSRLEEGYGLSEAGLRGLRARGVDLVITCDCGVTNVAEVAAVRGIGLDVVITDHHLPTAELPPAVAVVDPHRPDCTYPDPDLTGAGLAYKVAAALLDGRGITTDGLAAIAAIGTVADLAPMTGESRAIVRLGLAELAASPHAGLRALLARAADHPERPTARDLAFGVVPRINAAGRIDDVELAMGLLLETDAERADALATELEAVHLRRREMTVVAVERARELAAAVPGEGPLVLRDDAWAPGLVGLIAGRLVDLLARPAAIATLIGDEVRGSVRAPVDFHVARALEACAVHLTKRGGHAAAGGFSLRPDAWSSFVHAFGALTQPFPAVIGVAPQQPGRVTVDLVLPARFVDWSLADQLLSLEPYGPGHVEPVLAVTGMELVEARRVGPKQQHLALRLRRGIEAFDAVEFNADAERDALEPGASIDLVGTLERDEFGGFPRLRLRLIDFADARVSPLAGRRRVPGPVALARAG
jgi:single-stranded-DNA-specific exonuclease